LGGVPIPTRGIHCGTLYMYVLCGITAWFGQTFYVNFKIDFLSSESRVL
jgi:hypothetical protein